MPGRLPADLPRERVEGAPGAPEETGRPRRARRRAAVSFFSSSARKDATPAQDFSASFVQSGTGSFRQAAPPSRKPGIFPRRLSIAGLILRRSRAWRTASPKMDWMAASQWIWGLFRQRSRWRSGKAPSAAWRESRAGRASRPRRTRFRGSIPRRPGSARGAEYNANAPRDYSVPARRHRREDRVRWPLVGKGGGSPPGTVSATERNPFVSLEERLRDIGIKDFILTSFDKKA